MNMSVLTRFHSSFCHLCVAGILVMVSHSAQAVYFPGETMDPGCSPTDPNCTVDIHRIGSAKPYKFFDTDNTHFVGIQSPSTVGNNITLTLPTTTGASGQFLTTDGSGNLSWGTGSGVLPSQTGHAGKYLQTDGSSAQWVSVIGGGGGSPSGLTGAVQFTDGTNFTSNANFFWDNALQALGIGNNTPQDPLDVTGNIRISGTDNALLIENGSQYVGFKSPSGMSGSTLYTLPAAFPSDNSKVLQSSTTGTLSWVDAGAGSGGGMGVFVGKTTSNYIGSLSGGGKVGYPAANYICDQNFTGSHICSQTEMMYSIAQIDIATTADWTGAAWTMTGGAKYSPAPVPVNDCNGFTHGTSDDYLGSFWMFDQTDGGAGGVGHCANNIPLACCQ